MKQITFLEKVLENENQTQLGVGPMSKNFVDAVIELANEIKHPLMLIASRRQIECREQGSGYVNNWNTEDFAQYVREKDMGEYLILCRDHGGPWQNDWEKKEKMSLEKAMESAKKSFKTDIESGFEIIHIDPTIDIHKTPSREEVLERIFELYDFCQKEAGKNNKKIRIEIGTEEQSGSSENLFEFRDTLEKIKNFCQKNNYPMPLFVVTQTGTLVKEVENVGDFGKDLKQTAENPSGLIKDCQQFGVYLKEHNADYLSNEALSYHPKIGISAANIAPEFGVVETRYILKVCQEFGLKKEEQDFLELAFNSQKWQKWLKKESQATDREKAIMAGHYVFAKPEFKEIIERIKKNCSKKGFNFAKNLKQELKNSIIRIAKAFNII